MCDHPRFIAGTSGRLCEIGMRTALFDIETNGFKATRVFCMTVIDADTDEEFRFREHTMGDGIRLLESYDRIVAHNGIGFDFKVLRRLYGLNHTDEQCLDSLVLSRVLCGHLKEVDLDVFMQTRDTKTLGISGKLIGRHGIEAWGWRLGLHKGDYAKEMEAKGLDPWAEWNEDMDEYCANDTRVLLKLWKLIIAPHLGGRIFNFPVRVEFHSQRLNRATVATVRHSLPDNAYTVQNIPIAKGLLDAAKASGALDPKVMTSVSRVSFYDVPGFLNSNYTDAGVRHPTGGKLVHVESEKSATIPATGPDYYIRKLGAHSRTKKYQFWHNAEVDPTGDKFRDALRSFVVTPVLHTCPDLVVKLEHYMAWRMEELKQSGILFNVAEAERLAADLKAQSADIEARLRRVFRPKIVVKEVNRRSKLYTMDRPTTGSLARMLEAVAPKFISVSHYFRVSSRQQVGERLIEAGWNPDPEDVTKTGKPKITDDTLGKAVAYFSDHENATLKNAVEDIRLFYLIQKRIGQLATGGQAWLRLADKRGFIHPTIVPCAAVTARGTHSNPNISQVPAIVMVKKPNPDYTDDPKVAQAIAVLREEMANDPKMAALLARIRGAASFNESKEAIVAYNDYIKLPNPTKKELKRLERLVSKTKEIVGWGAEGDWGADSRKLFIVPPGFKQVGADLAGIELRMLAHYLFEFDNGRFMDIILTKDVHEENRKAIGFANRTDAKRFIFAFLYGAGDVKLGSIILPSGSFAQQKVIGRQFRDRLGTGIVGLAELVRKVRVEAAKGRILGLDGRIIPIRAEHAALNTLLQSGGAIVSKVWIRQMLENFNQRGLLYGYDRDYTFLLWSHDEVQYAVKEIHAETVMREAEEAAVRAGLELECRVPINAEGKIGVNWFETH